jgi:hypothetical protein
VTPLVPAYIWPTDDTAWETALAGPPGWVVVTGEESGPGPARSQLLADRIAWCRRKGWTPIGYVHLTFGNRPIGDVAGDIAAWRRWYSVDGIFFDEMPTGVTFDPAVDHDVETHGAVVLAQMLTEAVRRNGGKGVLNAGTTVPAEFWSATTFAGQWPPKVLIVTFEGAALFR